MYYAINIFRLACQHSLFGDIKKEPIQLGMVQKSTMAVLNACI